MGVSMLIIYSIAAGILVLSIMLLTIKYYLPKFANINHKATSEPHVTDLRRSHILAMLFSVCFFAYASYVLLGRELSVINIIKIILVVCILSCIFITDMEYMLIPNICPAILIAGNLIILFFEYIYMRDQIVGLIIDNVIAMLICLILLLMMSKLTHGGIGMGDVKLFSGIGFVCGIRVVCFTLAISFFLCAIISTILLIFRKKNLHDSLPLGPFVWWGYILTVLIF